MMDNHAIVQKLRDTALPLVPKLDAICAALTEGGIAVVRSDPGSGKSTLVPLALMAYGVTGRILMLESRRAAAMSVASRMADSLGEEPGERVGYAVHLQRKVSERTRIEVMTEGLFIRRLQGDPDLSGVSTVIFDEFHERSVNTDLALALMLDLRRMGAGIRLLVMSATMDAEKVADFINRAEDRTTVQSIEKNRDTAAGIVKKRTVSVIDCPGRVFPVDIGYRPLPEKAPLGREAASAAAAILSAEKGEGDTLVFLPGKREIEDARQVLAGMVHGGGENSAVSVSADSTASFEILVLHGGLPLEKQREIIAPRVPPDRKKRRRVILSTNVAETALTIPGITLVLDSGFVRLERYHLPTGMNRLTLEPVSRHSADQRAGRAGRLGPGRCVRLWSEAEPRQAETEAEIRRIDLSGLVLECLLWGASERTELPWLELPPEAAWERALGLLKDLGAIDANRKVTEKGRTMTRLGLEPRLAALCIAGKEAGRSAIACAAAAILSERAPPAKPAGGSAGNFAVNTGYGDGDFGSRLSVIRNNPHQSRTRSITETATELLRRLNGETVSLFWNACDEADIGELLASAFPDRIAALQESGKYRFVSGREARIEGSLERAEWIVAAEVDAGERLALIRLAAPISKERALTLLEPATVTETAVEWKGLLPRTVVTRRCGRLFLSEERRVSLREEAAADMSRLLREQGIDLLPWDDDKAAPRHLLERIRFFADHSTPAPSTWTGEALIDCAAEWLAPFVWNGNAQGSGPVITASGLVQALEARLGRERFRLSAEVPGSFTLPNGKTRPLDYSSGVPVLRVRLQDAFGIAESPRILGCPVVFHLLSPADRPIQITSDLAGFWAGSYAEVRREMRGRYPRHHWPELY
ncbi:ATP-dependent helicase HrpB [Spirochaetia bacterium]|nr:ATP-dependent helicase HrpB [Spirochaetia bacterium]